MEHLKDRIELLKRLELKGKRCVEIGVFKATYSQQIMLQDPAELILVDPWCKQDVKDYADINNIKDDEFERLYQGVVEGFKDFPQVKIMRMKSAEAVRMIEGPLDFVYVDGAHAFTHCFFDLCAWSTKIKDGGWLCGHDYEREIFFGCKQAVNYFCNATGYTVDIETDDAPSSFAIRIKK